jgi:four helix bundle protein
VKPRTVPRRFAPAIKVWEKAHQLTLEIYRVTVHFPRAEAYGLTSQIRRAGASIGTNLAEGCGREGDAELVFSCVN